MKSISNLQRSTLNAPAQQGEARLKRRQRSTFCTPPSSTLPAFRGEARPSGRHSPPSVLSAVPRSSFILHPSSFRPRPHSSFIPHPSSFARAFTLIELLTAISILTIIVFLLFSAFKSSSDVMIRNENKVEVNQVIRGVLDQVSRDLERALYTGSQAVNMYQGTPGGMNTPLIPGIPTNSLYLLSDLPFPSDSNCNGGFVNVGYQIATNNVGGVNKWCLMRGDDSLVDVSIPPGNSNNWWNTFTANTGVSSNSPCFNPNQWKVLSENVIGIQFYFYTNLVTYTADSFTDPNMTTNWSSLAVPNRLPNSVGVQIYSIDTDAYNKALRVDPTLASAASQTIIANNVRIYFTRVFLPRSTQNP